jgi:uncharacterized membrane protein HdeD (DUF308 family)
MKNNILKKSWQTMAISGVIATVIGLLFLFATENVLVTLIKWIGFILIVAAATLIILDIRNMAQKNDWGLFMFSSVIMLVLGLFCAIVPAKVYNFIFDIIGVWSIITGAYQIIVLLKFRHHISQIAFTIINGCLLIVLGIIFIFFPDTMAKAVTYIVGAFLIISGIWSLFYAFKFRKVIKSVEDEIKEADEVD